MGHGLTLRLHSCPDQSQRVTGELSAGAGHGAARQQHEDAGVLAVGAVLLQVAVLQSLEVKKEKQEVRKWSQLSLLCLFRQLQRFQLPESHTLTHTRYISGS